VIRVNVSGMSTNEMTTLIHEHGNGKLLVQVTSDMAGATEVATGAADYYFGSCTTGGGGALSMAIAILGYARCFTVSMPTKVSTEDEVRQAVESGKVAFGFTQDHVHVAVPMVVKAILAHRN
jgi:hypothetical protein